MTKTREDTLTRLASLLGLAKVHGLDTFALTVEDLAALEQFAPPKLQTLTLSIDAASIAHRFTGSERVIVDVMAERDRQDSQWGGPGHDDTHDVADWLAYIQSQGDKLFDGLQDGQMPEPEAARSRLVKIAALAFAAIESLDRQYPLADDTEPQPADPVASFRPYEDRAGEFRWRFVAVNGRIMADSSEGYSTASNVRRAIEDFRALVADATVEGIE